VDETAESDGDTPSSTEPKLRMKDGQKVKEGEMLQNGSLRDPRVDRGFRPVKFGDIIEGVTMQEQVMSSPAFRGR